MDVSYGISPGSRFDSTITEDKGSVIYVMLSMIIIISIIIIIIIDDGCGG